VRFVLAGVANEVGHGMFGLFRQARCEKVKLVLFRCGIVRSGRHGEVADGAVWSYQAWQARFNEVRLGAVRYGWAGEAGHGKV